MVSKKLKVTRGNIEGCIRIMLRYTYNRYFTIDQIVTLFKTRWRIDHSLKIEIAVKDVINKFQKDRLVIREKNLYRNMMRISSQKRGA